MTARTILTETDPMPLIHLVYRKRLYRFAEDGQGDPACHVYGNFFSWVPVTVERALRIMQNPKAVLVAPQEVDKWIQDMFLKRAVGLNHYPRKGEN